MSIEYYAGVPGPTVVVETKDDLAEALDLLHTQVIDNIGDQSPFLAVLEQAMEALDGLAE